VASDPVDEEVREVAPRRGIPRTVEVGPGEKWPVELIGRLDRLDR
jgi:hypothetical protein